MPLIDILPWPLFAGGALSIWVSLLIRRRRPAPGAGMLLWLRNGAQDFDYTLYNSLYDPPSYGPKHALLIVDSHYWPLEWEGMGTSDAHLRLNSRCQPGNATFTLQDTTPYTVRRADAAGAILETKTFEALPAVFDRLDAAGLVTVGACGDAVRNVTACPYAGVCSDEAFDVTPYSHALAWFLMGHPDTMEFGRKFKPAFSGCAHHACGLVNMHDFGAVARGGLRWSDRRDDFRTEVLGLVKAQMVKNVVIVPVGSKGGFYVKRPPAGGRREQLQAEGIACYQTLIRGLLDITDNYVEGKVVPADCVRHDGDDPYLVVAADKGTATFSDIANALAREYGFWLDDAFASGGSVGYDHKLYGITAKGGWVCVQRHFREMGIDTQKDFFTVTGIGDMSGDVFGNGLLLSHTIKLVAAFDHRHIFLDPDPDPASSLAERQRLFDLPRSSWGDYDSKFISAGGGVWPRAAKSVPISPQGRSRLAIEEIGRAHV